MAFMRQSFVSFLIGSLILTTLLLVGCSSTSGTNTGTGSGSATATATTTAKATAAPSATAQASCTQFVPGATPFSSVNGVPNLQPPAGSYISAGSASGGGQGQYSIETYTLCYQGNEAAIDGGNLTSGNATSTIGLLVHDGWTLNNLFPDPSNFAYLDYCSNAHVCVNDSGSPNPFTFVGFDQYVSQSVGYTAVRLEVATIAAPTCLNDPNYYSGTPAYALYQDSKTVTPSSSPQDHFLMPPGTRDSSFLGGGTAGSTYVYYCSAGTQATVVSFLKQSMQNTGWTITNASASGFIANKGTNPTFSIQVDVQNPNNYYLRIFVPQ